jgi:hypothetical protein
MVIEDTTSALPFRTNVLELKQRDLADRLNLYYGMQQLSEKAREFATAYNDPASYEQAKIYNKAAYSVMSNDTDIDRTGVKSLSGDLTGGHQDPQGLWWDRNPPRTRPAVALIQPKNKPIIPPVINPISGGLFTDVLNQPSNIENGDFGGGLNYGQDTTNPNYYGLFKGIQ